MRASVPLRASSGPSLERGERQRQVEGEGGEVEREIERQVGKREV